jgi:hypothetical protein
VAAVLQSPSVGRLSPERSALLGLTLVSRKCVHEIRRSRNTALTPFCLKQIGDGPVDLMCDAVLLQGLTDDAACLLELPLIVKLNRGGDALGSFCQRSHVIMARVLAVEHWEWKREYVHIEVSRVVLATRLQALYRVCQGLAVQDGTEVPALGGTVDRCPIQSVVDDRIGLFNPTSREVLTRFCVDDPVLGARRLLCQARVEVHSIAEREAARRRLLGFPYPLCLSPPSRDPRKLIELLLRSVQQLPCEHRDDGQASRTRPIGDDGLPEVDGHREFLFNDPREAR